MTIAAIYVMPRGPYYGLPDVIPYGLPERDARKYAGPWPVVAHPPCGRWGRYWGGGPMLHGTALPELQWGRCGKRLRIDPDFHSTEERRRLIKTGVCQRLSKRQRTATPIEFRDLLLGMARSVYLSRVAA